ncbi:MAG: toll/interleukin-1 receptor domain-containing protein [Ruminococcaceae bacterium]|nr:toll/interleukin-1 receptor domain-containing protein [Oscillospiraceae bacterium]
MKRGLSIFLILLVVISVNVSGALYYPSNDGKPATVAEKTERINIVFDNSGHDGVKTELINILYTAVIAEHSEVWVYPIAGSNPVIKVEPTKEFIEANFTKYSKASNEFKPENVMETAINDLKSSPYSSKRLIFMMDLDTGSKNSNYDYWKLLHSIPGVHPEVTFSFAYQGTSMIDKDHTDFSNYDSVDGDYLDFILLRNGYAQCEAAYDKELGYAEIAQGRADKNLFVYADDSNTRQRIGDEYVKGLFLSGCVMGKNKYSDYLSKNKVKGVALSYNHIVAETDDDDGSTFAAALYTLDGDAVNPEKEAIIIPILNAGHVKIYHRETPQTGICSKDAVYDCSYDKKIPNLYKEEDENPLVSTDKESVPEFPKEEASKEKSGFNIISVLGAILKWIVGIIVAIISFVFSLLPLTIVVFSGLFFSNEKFRSNVRLKFNDSKLAPVIEWLEGIYEKIKGEYFGGTKVRVRGTKNPKGKYIFICKKTEDMANGNSRASKIVRELQRRGISCWLSEDSIPIGEDHEDAIPPAIQDSSMFLIFLSTRSIHSKQVISEFKTAKDKNKVILPVLIEDFDLLGKYENWKFRLQPYQMEKIFSSRDEDIKNLADKIERRFKEETK